MDKLKKHSSDVSLDNVKPNRIPEDLLFQVLVACLDTGAAKINVEQIFLQPSPTTEVQAI